MLLTENPKARKYFFICQSGFHLIQALLRENSALKHIACALNNVTSGYVNHIVEPTQQCIFQFPFCASFFLLPSPSCLLFYLQLSASTRLKYAEFHLMHPWKHNIKRKKNKGKLDFHLKSDYH